MTNIAYELTAKLRHLTLVGQENDGELMFMGSDRQWNNADDEMNDYVK